MFNKWMAGAAIVVGGMLGSTWLRADAPADVKAAIDKSMKAMGADNLKTIVISGEGANGAMARVVIRMTIGGEDSRTRAIPAPSISTCAPGMFSLYARKGDPRSCGGNGTTNPSPDSPTNTVTMAGPTAMWNTQLEYILLPEGFLKVAAEKSDAKLSTESMKGKKYTVITFMGDNKQPVKGYLDEMGYIDRVETTVAGMDPIGDAIWFAEYDGYKDFIGVKFPTHILQRQGPIKNPPKYFELNIADVR